MYREEEVIKIQEIEDEDKNKLKLIEIKNFTNINKEDILSLNKIDKTSKKSSNKHMEDLTGYKQIINEKDEKEEQEDEKEELKIEKEQELHITEEKNLNDNKSEDKEEEMEHFSTDPIKSILN